MDVVIHVLLRFNSLLNKIDVINLMKFISIAVKLQFFLLHNIFIFFMKIYNVDYVFIFLLKSGDITQNKSIKVSRWSWFYLSVSPSAELIWFSYFGEGKKWPPQFFFNFYQVSKTTIEYNRRLDFPPPPQRPLGAYPLVNT